MPRRRMRKWRYKCSGCLNSATNESKHSASTVASRARKTSRALWIGGWLRPKASLVAVSKRPLLLNDRIFLPSIVRAVAYLPLGLCNSGSTQNLNIVLRKTWVQAFEGLNRFELFLPSSQATYELPSYLACNWPQPLPNISAVHLNRCPP
jgi:hypothetical protein